MLFFSGVLSWGEDGVEDVFGVGIGEILGVDFSVLNVPATTLLCFLPELDTSTGLEYFTKLWGWLKLEGPEADICNLI